MLSLRFNKSEEETFTVSFLVLQTTWPDAHTKMNFCGQRLGAAGTTDSCRQDHNYMMLQRGYLQPNGHHSLLWTRPQLYEVTERLFTAKWSPQFAMNKAIIIWSYKEVIHSQEITTVCCEQGITIRGDRGDLDSRIQLWAAF